MKSSSRKELAASLNVDEDVLPYLNELLADIWILGSSPHRIAKMLEALMLSPNQSRILDLGCGKGAVAITLAEELGARVDGYDCFKPFLDEAIRKAREHNVSDLCRFKLADIREIVTTARDYDVVTLASVGTIGADLESTVGHLRKTVREGGYILIDDGFVLDDEHIDFQGYEYVATHDECIRQLTAHGDRLIREVIVPKDEVIAYNQRNNEVIAQRAEELTKCHPDKAQIFSNFVQKEKDECDIIEKQTEEAIWLLQKC